MPRLVECPHCSHPCVVPAGARGKGRLCRQCGQGYLVPRRESAVRALPVASQADLIHFARTGRFIYRID